MMSQEPLPTATKTSDAATQLLELARGENRERRAHGREPFFYPAVVVLDDQPDVRHSAFVRDISAEGMGLFHLMPLDRQPLTVITRMPDEKTLTLRLQLVWCRPCGSGCYLSGGRLLDE